MAAHVADEVDADAPLRERHCPSRRSKRSRCRPLAMGCRGRPYAGLPGADPLIGHRETARAALDGSQPIPAGSQTPLSQAHIRILLGQIPLRGADLDVLAIQLTAALDGPLLLYLSESDLTEAAPKIAERIAQSWQDLVQRVCRP